MIDKEAWNAAVHGVAKSWTHLSNWTELNWSWGKRTLVLVEGPSVWLSRSPALSEIADWCFWAHETTHFRKRFLMERFPSGKEVPKDPQSWVAFPSESFLQIRRLSLEGALPTFVHEDSARSPVQGHLWRFSLKNLEQSFHGESYLLRTEADLLHVGIRPLLTAFQLVCKTGRGGGFWLLRGRGHYCGAELKNFWAVAVINNPYLALIFGLYLCLFQRL